MLKLMKYEYKKQALSKLVILALLAVVEIIFFVGVIINKESTMAIGLGLLSFITWASILYVSFESIITFSNDLKTKCSYMLFLTPNTSYRIIGAKVLLAGIQILVVGLLFLGVIIGDVALLVVRYDKVADVKILIEDMIKQFMNVNISLQDGVLAFLMILLAWISTITIAFFSITLSTTFLANSKLKGIVSFAIFVGINWLSAYISAKTIGATMNDTFIYLNSLYALCFTVITYLGTSWMLEKKVSL